MTSPNAAPIVPWIGGKRRLFEKLITRLPDHHCYVEPFAGGAALYFMRPQPAKVEVLNDINSDLVNLYRVVKCHLEEFVRQFRWALSSRELFKWLQSTPPVNLLRIEEELSAAHLRLAQTYIEHLPWHECVQRYDRPHTLFYCDPPYWQTTGYGVPFGWDQYERLADVMRTVKGKVLLSINDHDAIRALFAGFDMEELSINYIVGGGAKASRARELLIYSWPRDAADTCHTARPRSRRTT